MIYRVTVGTTNSLQPGRGSTFWQKRVAYCGTSLTDARVEYLRSCPQDFGGSHGNGCRRTSIEQFEDEPDEIDDVTSEEVEC